MSASSSSSSSDTANQKATPQQKEDITPGQGTVEVTLQAADNAADDVNDDDSDNQTDDAKAVWTEDLLGNQAWALHPAGLMAVNPLLKQLWRPLMRDMPADQKCFEPYMKLLIAVIQDEIRIHPAFNPLTWDGIPALVDLDEKVRVRVCRMHP